MKLNQPIGAGMMAGGLVGEGLMSLVAHISFGYGLIFAGVGALIYSWGPTR